MGITTDPNDPGLRKDRGDGQNETYLVLSEEERAKGFVRPLRRAYIHKGIRPEGPTRDLTPDELARYEKYGYVQYEEYNESHPRHGGSALGRYWTAAALKGGCGALTSMGAALCETYARDPKFYGATFCCGCGKHLPVAEFVWDEDGAVVGS